MCTALSGNGRRVVMLCMDSVCSMQYHAQNVTATASAQTRVIKLLLLLLGGAKFGKVFLTGGTMLISVFAYGLVLWAQTQGPLGPIAALRETSIIVGALIGAVVFHERFGRPRTVAAVVIAAGIVVLTLG